MNRSRVWPERAPESHGEPWRGRGRLRPAGWLVAALIVMSFSARAAAESVDEKTARAAFLYRFATFVEWPAEALSDSTGPVTFGVLGAAELDPALRLIERKTVKQHTIIVRLLEGLDRVAGCHVLFIADADESKLPEIVAAARRHHVLTVSDRLGFTAQGGMIALFRQGDKFRFAINREEARAAGLKISSQLLTLAQDDPGESGAAKPKPR